MDYVKTPAALDPLLMAIQKNTLHPIRAASLDHFFKANGIEFNASGLDSMGKTKQEYFEALEELLFELSQVIYEVRMLILLTISWSIRNHDREEMPFVEACYVPHSYFEKQEGSAEWSIFKTATNNLENQNLVVNNAEGDSLYEFPHVAVAFSGKVEGLNCFPLLCQYFREAEKMGFIKDTIVNCDFSNIT